MECAGSHAYVSKNFIEAYMKKKQKRQQKMQKKELEVVQESMEQQQDQLMESKEDQQIPMIQSSLMQDISEAQETKPKMLQRRRSNVSCSDEEEEGRCRSMESLFEGELGGDLNLSDQEDDYKPQP